MNKKEVYLLETIKIIADKLKQTTRPNEWTMLLKRDERAGVQQLVASWEKKLERERRILAAHEEKIRFDESFKKDTEELIAGIDEAGRGPLAGPVVTAAVIFGNYPPELVGLNDSKQLSREKREKFAEVIKKYAKSYSIHIQPVEQIDEMNIYEATKGSMSSAVINLDIKPDCLLVDAMKLPLDIRQSSIIKGDAKSLSIAAASILAKTERDSLMDEYDRIYPEYHFSKNAGYGTPDHLEALKKHGPTSIHRKSFEPIKSMSLT